MAKRLAKIRICVSLLGIGWLCGCASPVALRHDFDDFSEVCADVNNRQLVLNLARLSQNDPVYFLQLGSFSSQYAFSAMGQFSASATRTDPVSGGTSAAGTFIQHALMYGGNASAGVTETPIFQFFPITGTNLVDAILTPVSDKVYLILYDQGYHADLVARTLVSTVQKLFVRNDVTIFVTNSAACSTAYSVTNPLANSVTSFTWVVTNSLPPSVPASGAYLVTNSVVTSEFYVNDPMDPSFQKFLRFCADLRNAQINHALTVDQTNSSTVIYQAPRAKLADVAAIAAQSGLSVSLGDATNPVVVKKNQSSTTFVVNNVQSPDFTKAYTSRYELPTPETKLVSDTESSSTKLDQSLLLAANIAGNVYKLKTRTFEGVMYAAAKQNEYFKRMEATNRFSGILFSNDDFGACAVVTKDNVHDGDLTVRPLLMLNYDGVKCPPATKEFEVRYHNKSFYISDPLGSQNHTVFTIINYLFAQTAVSSQNLPVQQLIQVQ
jgi:hypothetical protein